MVSVTEPKSVLKRESSRKGLSEFSKLATTFMDTQGINSTPSAASAMTDHAIQFLFDHEVEVLVLSKVPGVLEQIQREFGFDNWNVYMGNEPPAEDPAEAAKRNVAPVDIRDDQSDTNGSIAPSEIKSIEMPASEISSVQGKSSTTPKSLGRKTPTTPRAGSISASPSKESLSGSKTPRPTSAGLRHQRSSSTTGNDAAKKSTSTTPKNAAPAKAEPTQEIPRHGSLVHFGSSNNLVRSNSASEIANKMENKLFMDRRAEERDHIRKHCLANPFQAQLTIEVGGSPRRFAFSIPEPNNEKATLQAIGQAHIILAEPNLIDPHIQIAKNLIWLQSSHAGVDALIDTVFKQRAEAEHQKAEYEIVRAKFEADKAAMIGRIQALEVKLDEHVPILKEANDRLNQLDREDLADLRTLKRPPPSVQVCLEAVVTLLGETNASDWNEVLKVVCGPNFKYEVLDFDPFSVSKEKTAKIKADYVKSEHFSHDKVDRSFYACGALSRWLEAQLQLNDNTELLRPMKDEVYKNKTDLQELAFTLASSILQMRKYGDFTLTKMGGVFGPHVTEYCVSQIVANERKFGAQLALQQQKQWAPSSSTYRSFSRLKIGILGVGDIGCHMAKVFKAVGATTQGYSRREKAQPVANFDKLFAAETKDGSQLAEFLKDVDYVVNTLPATSQTRRLLNGDILKNCKPGAVLVNVGHGQIISEPDLLNALDQNWIGGAILDSVEQEPLPANLRHFANSEALAFLVDISQGY